MTRKIVAGLLLGAGSALVVLVLAWTKLGALDRLDLQLYDWSLRRIAQPALANQDIVLVEINDATIRDYAPAVGRWPWPRVLQSNLIDFLQRAPARVIAYDIQLSEPSSGSFTFGDDTWTGEESDDAMVTSTRTAGNVILLADATNPGMTGAATQPSTAPEWSSPYRLGPLAEARPVITPPFKQLNQSAGHRTGWNRRRVAPDRTRQAAHDRGGRRSCRRSSHLPQPDASVSATFVVTSYQSPVSSFQFPVSSCQLPVANQTSFVSGRGLSRRSAAGA